jgi:hypothetical protein
MLKYLTKLAMEIFPSVLATIIGAYIVNHYISARPTADTPAAAMASVNGTKVDAKTDSNKTDSNKTDSSKTASKQASTEVASLPEPGIKAKGIAEKAILGLGRATTESVSEKSVEAAIAPVETRHKVEKPIAKATPASASAAPVVTAPTETAAIPDEHPDATELARAAIERLRNEAPARTQEAVRAPEPPRVQETPRVVVAAPPSLPIRPLPPPITVGGSAVDTSVAAAPPQTAPYTGAVRDDDPSRPTPPADIPAPPPLNLHATDMSPREQATRVAEDMLSAAKSVFQAVLPKSHRDSDPDRTFSH